MKLIIKSQNEETSENKTPGTDQDRKRWINNMRNERECINIDPADNDIRGHLMIINQYLKHCLKI